MASIDKGSSDKTYACMIHIGAWHSLVEMPPLSTIPCSIPWAVNACGRVDYLVGTTKHSQQKATSGRRVGCQQLAQTLIVPRYSVPIPT